MDVERSSVDCLDDIILEPFLNDGYAELHDDLQEYIFDYQDEKLDQRKTQHLNNGNIKKDANKTNTELIENKKEEEKLTLVNNNHVNKICNDEKHEEEIMCDKNHLRKRKAEFETVNSCKNRKIQENSVHKIYSSEIEEPDGKSVVKVRSINCKKYIFISLKISIIFCLLIVFLYYIFIFIY